MTSKIKDKLVERLTTRYNELTRNTSFMPLTSGDIGDVAFNATENLVETKVAEYGSNELAKVSQALIRVKNDTYGMCENCDKQIPTKRLEAMPYSTMCIGCQELHEAGKI